ncbi:MAG: hypothetical protein V1800_04910 [Candidatus Latescibacterota bacterium]
MKTQKSSERRHAPPTPVAVGSRKQLFVDEAFFAVTRNVGLTMNPPEKTYEATIGPDRPWEMSIGNGSVVQVGDEYRMYYSASYVYQDGSSAASVEPSSRLCMAVSSDGIHWSKPSLGLVEFQGSKDNNIVFPGEDAWLCGATVFLDTRPGLPDDEAFKGIFRWTPPGVPPSEISEWVFKSPDGLHWTPMRDRQAFRYSDTDHAVFWDERIGKYVVYMRYNSSPYYNAERVIHEGFRHGRPMVFANGVALRDGKVPGHDYCAPDDGRIYTSMSYRKVGRYELDNLSLWDEPANWGGTPPVTALDFDESDPPGMDIDNCGALKYPFADNVYLMFPAMNCHLPDPPAGIGHNDAIFEVRLATSRDGVRYHYPASRSLYLPLGVQGEFDSGLVSVLPGSIVRNGPRLYQYYHARDYALRHGVGWRELIKEDRYRPPVISRMVTRLDGFVSVDAPYEGGEFTTPPMTFEGDSLQLNVQTSFPGCVKVELLSQGQPVAGRKLDNADPISGNFIDRACTWNGNSEVSALAGKPVQLRFVMRDAKLYAFQFMSS